MGSADVRRAREEGWIVGTRLVGDEGYGPTVIRITAIGEQQVLAVTESRNGVPEKELNESSWTFSMRDWKVYEPKAPWWEVVIAVPAHVPFDMREDLFSRLTQTVNDWEPEDRKDWDTLMSSGIVG